MGFAPKQLWNKRLWEAPTSLVYVGYMFGCVVFLHDYVKIGARFGVVGGREVMMMVMKNGWRGVK